MLFIIAAERNFQRGENCAVEASACLQVPGAKMHVIDQAANVKLTHFKLSHVAGGFADNARGYLKFAD